MSLHSLINDAASTPRGITKIRYYQCGYCVNEMSHIYKGYPKEKRIFPAGVFLLEHATEGRILFDTGYSRDIFTAGWRSKLYQALNPATVTAEDELSAQLEKDGIAPESINYVILSHLHPDHIGGVKFFPQSTFVLSQESYDVFRTPKLADLVFPSFLPNWFAEKVHVVDSHRMLLDTNTGVEGHDFFGDGSLLLTGLNGHARGHVGAYLPGQLLLAADASWGTDLIDYTDSMRFPARLIQADYGEYKRTVGRVKHLREMNIDVYFSHERYSVKDIL